MANGTPAIHVRQPSDTRKGQMWRDVGLGDWLFEVETSTGEDIASRLLSIHRAPSLARQRTGKAREFAAARARDMVLGIRPA